MYPRRRAAIHQQQRIRRYAEGTDSHGFFNLLTAPQLLDTVESLLPEHRERLFPPTETLSMFLAQARGIGVRVTFTLGGIGVRVTLSSE